MWGELTGHLQLPGIDASSKVRIARDADVEKQVKMKTLLKEVSLPSGARMMLQPVTHVLFVARP
jgi:hypothetical protein